MTILTKGLLEKICNRIFLELGPFHSEAVYGNAIEYELIENKIHYRREVQVPIKYKGVIVGQSRVDFLIKPNNVIELKASPTNRFNKDGTRSNYKGPIKDRNQVIKYLQSMEMEKGYLVNFNIGTKAEVEIDEIFNPLLSDENGGGLE